MNDEHEDFKKTLADIQRPRTPPAPDWRAQLIAAFSGAILEYGPLLQGEPEQKRRLQGKERTIGEIADLASGLAGRMPDDICALLKSAAPQHLLQKYLYTPAGPTLEAGGKLLRAMYDQAPHRECRLSGRGYWHPSRAVMW